MRVILLVVLLVLMIVPGWSGESKLHLLEQAPNMAVKRVTLDPRDPDRRRVGALTFLGGVSLTSRDPAFGGFSSMTVVGDRFTLLSDGGNIVGFRMGADWAPHGLSFANVPGGPALGWQKADRDSESMTIDPATGQIWVGYENYNAIWRYAPGFARVEGHVEPKAMEKWPSNGGPESLFRLHDGRFVTISEQAHVPKRLWRGPGKARMATRIGLIFAGDPVVTREPVAKFGYIPPPHHDVSDITQLPDGDLLVLDRRFRLPFRFSVTISLVPAAALRAGAVIRGRPIATLDAPLVHDNFEGIATTREGDDTIIWLVSDDNQLPIQRSLLLKFRLDPRKG